MSGDLPPCPHVWGYFPDLEPTPPPLGIDIPIRDPDRRSVRAKPEGHKRDYGTAYALDGMKRCPQCWEIKEFPAEFDGYHNCNDCREKKKNA